MSVISFQSRAKKRKPLDKPKRVRKPKVEMPSVQIQRMLRGDYELELWLEHQNDNSAPGSRCP